MATGADTYLNNILTKVYGQEVRQAIYDALKYCCDNDVSFETAWNNFKTSLETSLNSKKTEVNNTLNSKKTEVTNTLNSKKTEVANTLNDLEQTVLNTLDALIYINELTGAVVIHGANLKLNYSTGSSMTVAQCLGMCASDVSASKISGTDDDYQVNITLGGLI